MKETRRFAIKQKIFTKRDLLNIGELFLSEYSAAKENEERASIEFRISCPDGTSYESESIEFFDNGGVLDRKIINTFEITFHNYSKDNYINITVVRGGGYNDELVVKGENPTWVNGVFNRLKEIIDLLKPQDNFIIRHKTFLLHLISFGVGVFIYFILWLMFYRHIEPIKNPTETIKTIRTFFKAHPFLMFILDWVMFWLLGIPWAPYIRRWLLTLWPNIEFDFGPEHFKVEKKRRMRLAMVFSVAIIPIVLSIGYDLAKLFITK